MKVATPELTVPVPRVVVPSVNVTVPVGVAVLPAAGVMVAVKVMLDPAVMVEAEAVRAVVVEACVVTTGTLPYRLRKTVEPARMSGLPSLLRSTAIAGAPPEMLIRSLGMM